MSQKNQELINDVRELKKCITELQFFVNEFKELKTLFNKFGELPGLVNRVIEKFGELEEEVCPPDVLPSGSTFIDMIGVNMGKEYDNFPHTWAGPAFKNVFTSAQLRIFHLMEDDYNGRFPSEVEPIWEHMNLWSWRYRNMKDRGYKIRISLESIFQYNPFIERKFPNKWFSRDQWGGSDTAIRANAKKYMLSVLKFFRVSDAQPNPDGEFLIDTLEIGNEPWGEPGEAAYKMITKGIIDACIEFYNSENPDDWELSLSHAAFQNTMPENRFSCNTCNYPTGDFLPNMIDEADFKYIKEINCHSYAFDNSNGEELTIHPESSDSKFNEFTDMVTFAQDRNLKISITEFGWNSEQVGEFAQAAYLMRSLLIFARHGAHKAYMYEMVDDIKAPPFKTCGIFKDTTEGGDKIPESPKQAIQAFDTLLSQIGTMKHFEVVQENEEFYVYKIGISEPTHIVAWRPIDMKFWNSDQELSFDFNGQQIQVGGVPKVFEIQNT